MDLRLRPAGRQTSNTDPDRGATTSIYDDGAQLTSTTDARGVTLAYLYDQLGRKKELREGSPTGTLRASWAYDTVAKGQPTSSTRHVGAATYTTAVTSYDDGYRPLGQSVTLPSTGAPTGEGVIAGTYTTQFTYTVDGLLKTLKHPTTANLNQETVTTFYDTVGIPEWMGGGFGWGTYVSGSQYSHLAQPLMLDLSNSYVEQVMFNYQHGTNRLDRMWLVREGISGHDLVVQPGFVM